jgi:DNA mismatch endonuclease, patch repair protein
MMSGIRGQDTSPERLIRQELHRRGFRFRLHYKGLPGRPDIVLPKHRVVIQVHGCFWHRHNCHLFKWPATQSQRWRDKLEANVVRDAANLRAYETMGWRTLIVWECALKGKMRLSLEEVGKLAERWIREGSDFMEICG